jgi:hypothetical protein
VAICCEWSWRRSKWELRSLYFKEDAPNVSVKEVGFREILFKDLNNIFDNEKVKGLITWKLGTCLT